MYAVLILAQLVSSSVALLAELVSLFVHVVEFREGQFVYWSVYQINKCLFGVSINVDVELEYAN